LLIHLKLHPHTGHDGIDVVEIYAAAVQLMKALAKVGFAAPLLEILHHLQANFGLSSTDIL